MLTAMESLISRRSTSYRSPLAPAKPSSNLAPVKTTGSWLLWLSDFRGLVEGFDLCWLRRNLWLLGDRRLSISLGVVGVSWIVSGFGGTLEFDQWAVPFSCDG